MIPYIGKVDYCYSNSAAMLLASIGEQIDPGHVEALTGMGIGAFLTRDAGLLFFDCTDPDRGISRALRSLGFDFREGAHDDSAFDPMPDLAHTLTEGPALLGPVELGLLSYNPHMRGETGAGADHYVLAYDMDSRYVYLHDPWGYPCARIAHDELRAAWRADAIDYRRGHYRQWTRARRVERPTGTDLYLRAVATYQEVIRIDKLRFQQQGLVTGSDAILALATSASRGPLHASVRGFLTSFSLPLATRRAIDIANFLAPYNQALSELKDQQAALLGTAHCQAAAACDGALSETLRAVASAEDRFERAVLEI